MEERFIEIKFYYWMQKLLFKFRYSYAILDVIDAYCLLAEVDSTIIKHLLQQIRNGAGPIVPNKEEAVYVARSVKYSYRNFAKLTGIALSNQLRLYDLYIDKNEEDILKPVLNDEQHYAVSRFMRIVDILKEV